MSSPEPYINSLLDNGKALSRDFRATSPVSDSELPEPYIQAAYGLHPIAKLPSSRVEGHSEDLDRPLTDMEIVNALFLTEIPESDAETADQQEKLPKRRQTESIRRQDTKERIQQSRVRRQAAMERRKQQRKVAHASNATQHAEPDTAIEQKSRGMKRQAESPLFHQAASKRSRKEGPSAGPTPDPGPSPPAVDSEAEAGAMMLVSMRLGQTTPPTLPSLRTPSRGQTSRTPLPSQAAMSPITSSTPARHQPVAGPRTEHAPGRKTVQLGDKTVDKTTVNDRELAARIESNGRVMIPRCKCCEGANRECKFLPGASSRCGYCCARKGKCEFESDEPKKWHLKAKQKAIEARKAAASKERRSEKKMTAPRKEPDDDEPELQRGQLDKQPSADRFVSKLGGAVEAREARTAATPSSEPTRHQSQESPERVSRGQAQEAQDPFVREQTSVTAPGTASPRRRPSSDSMISNNTLPIGDVFSPPRQQSRTPDSSRSPTGNDDLGEQEPESLRQGTTKAEELMALQARGDTEETGSGLSRQISPGT